MGLVVLPDQREWIAVLNVYPSEMAQNFWTAIWAWTICFVVTIIISLATRIGFLFTTLGVLLTLFGLFTMQSPMYWHSLGMNINLGWGILLLIFGLRRAFAARKSQARIQQAQKAGPRERQSPSKSANP